MDTKKGLVMDWYGKSMQIQHEHNIGTLSFAKQEVKKMQKKSLVNY